MQASAYRHSYLMTKLFPEACPMSSTTRKLVEDIAVGQPDARGIVVDTIFARVSQKYCVYKSDSDNRIMIQFADDETVGDEQRLCLSRLEPERSTINAEFDGWQSALWKFRRNSNRHSQLVMGFSYRIAQAAVSALSGDPVTGKSQLQSVLDDIQCERLSIGRVEYFLTALAVGVAFVVLAWLALLVPFGCEPPVGDTPMPFGCFANGGGLVLAIGMASLGALFSIAMAIRDRNIQTDKSRRSNIMDASLRMGVAVVASIVLFALLFSDYVTISFGENEVTGDLSKTAWPAMVVAFIAGFFERLVSNFLATNPATLALAGGANGAPALPPPNMPISGPNGNGGAGTLTASGRSETDAKPDTAVVPSPTLTVSEVEEEEALASSPGEGIEAADATADEQLPPAYGGVENETR
jgi:hypothetical protein